MKEFIIRIVGTYINILGYVSGDYAANKALRIFSKPRKGKLKPKHITFLETAQKEILKYDTFDIATYHWKGDHTTILLVHGWESNAARWKNKINSFIKEGFNIIALDAPAHGASSGELFNALLYSEFINVVASKYKPEVIIGHSVGGMASVFYQQKYQLDTLNKMVLLGAPSEFESILKDYIKLLGYNKKIEKGLHRVILKKFGAKPSEFSTSKFSKDIEAEALIMHDVKDLVIPYSDAELIKKNFKNSTLIPIQGSNHSLNTPVVTKNILDFLDK